MNSNCCANQMDYGGIPYTANVMQHAMQNANYRTALWTGEHLQMTLMCIPVCSDVGEEIHEDTDQIIRVEQGMALVKMWNCQNDLLLEQNLCPGATIFVPAGTWHNVINIGRMPLKLSSIYAPPHHPFGTVQCSKADATAEQY